MTARISGIPTIAGRSGATQPDSVTTCDDPILPMLAVQQYSTECRTMSPTATTAPNQPPGNASVPTSLSRREKPLLPHSVPIP